MPPGKQSPAWTLPLLLASLLTVLAALPVPQAHATPADDFAAGNYEAVQALDPATLDGDGLIFSIQSALALGRYREAVDIARLATQRFPTSPPVHLAAFKAFDASGLAQDAQNSLLAASRNVTPGNPPNQPADAAAAGRALWRLGAEPRLVLDQLLELAQKEHPDDPTIPFAIGELALAKRDANLASIAFRKGLEKNPDNVDLRLGLAEAMRNGPPREPLELTAAVLSENPRHPRALLLRADLLLDQSDDPAAVETLDQLLALNPNHPSALARQSALATFHDDPTTATTLRERALVTDSTNPEIDRTIGTFLAGRYRFSEGIAALRRALELDPADLKTQFELGTNLLRYGGDSQGWQLIENVHQLDPYHVAAYNLIVLRDQMADFESSTSDAVGIRLAPLDAAILGPRALDLAREARDTFAKKYNADPATPLTLEIFPDQQDFAIRTFDLPGGEGFLGVCFGPLITMTSPRGRLGRANWEAVVWHEVAHTITLGRTKHRIPRWLSEGISVHEERLKNPAWTTGMNSRFRRTILDRDAYTLANLDTAFREDIEFAYFEAGLAVDFLVANYGQPALNSILADLADGTPVNDALATHTAPARELDAEFRRFLETEAKAYGNGIDWAPISDEEYDAFALDPAAWLANQPTRYDAALLYARQLSEAGEWQKIVTLLKPFIELEPNNREQPNPYLLLANAHRQLGDTAAERAALEKLITLDAGSQPATERLLALARASDDPSALTAAARRVLAINPFDQSALRTLAQSATTSGDSTTAIRAYESLLATSPPDPTRIRYELAAALQPSDPTRARREVLRALESSPRFRAALQLLQTLPPSQTP